MTTPLWYPIEDLPFFQENIGSKKYSFPGAIEPLQKVGVCLIGDFLKYNPYQLACVPNFGALAMANVLYWFGQNGVLFTGMDHKPDTLKDAKAVADYIYHEVFESGIDHYPKMLTRSERIGPWCYDVSNYNQPVKGAA